MKRLSNERFSWMMMTTCAIFPPPSGCCAIGLGTAIGTWSVVPGVGVGAGVPLVGDGVTFGAFGAEVVLPEHATSPHDAIAKAAAIFRITLRIA